MAGAAARRLRSSGVALEVVVAICVDEVWPRAGPQQGFREPPHRALPASQGWMMVLAQLAVMMAGGAFVPIDLSFPPACAPPPTLHPRLPAAGRRRGSKRAAPPRAGASRSSSETPARSSSSHERQTSPRCARPRWRRTSSPLAPGAPRGSPRGQRQAAGRPGRRSWSHYRPRTAAARCRGWTRAGARARRRTDCSQSSRSSPPRRGRRAPPHPLQTRARATRTARTARRRPTASAGFPPLPPPLVLSGHAASLTPY